MSEIDSGGMAFPVTPTDRSGQIGPTEYGLTKRELYAGMALQGILSNPTTVTSKLFKTTDGFMNSEMIAECAYEQADAMIRAGKGEK